jgi:hypothetical protein
MIKAKSGLGDLFGCFGKLVFLLLWLAFMAGCALVAIAIMVWAYRYLFG